MNAFNPRTREVKAGNSIIQGNLSYKFKASLLCVRVCPKREGELYMEREARKGSTLYESHSKGDLGHPGAQKHSVVSAGGKEHAQCKVEGPIRGTQTGSQPACCLQSGDQGLRS